MPRRQKNTNNGIISCKLPNALSVRSNGGCLAENRCGDPRSNGVGGLMNFKEEIAALLRAALNLQRRNMLACSKLTVQEQADIF